MNSKAGYYSTIEELEEYFSKRITLLNDCLELKGLDNHQRNIFRDFELKMIELREAVLNVRHMMQRSQNQLVELKDLSNRMNSLNERLDHMQNNFPSFLKPNSNETSKKEKVEVHTTPKITKKGKMPVKIKYITLDEFKNIPFYMKGRMQYEDLNRFIDTFNKIITAKYKLLSMPQKQMKPADYKKVQAMKLEENDATKNSFFCTEGNMKEYGNFKIDKIVNNYISVLRHHRRIKEIRGPGPIVRYVIMEI